MKTQFKILTLFILAISTISTLAISSTNAQSIDSDIDLEDGVLFIEGDWTHDEILIFPNGGEIVVEIKQYETIESMELDEPSRTRDRDFDIEDVDMIYIMANEGNDIVRISPINENAQAYEVAVTAFCGSGDDRFYSAQSGIHAVYGGDGKDTIHYSAYSPQDFVGWFFGGAGDDEIMSHHSPCRIYGEDDDDMIYGSWNDDFIDGGNGDDMIFALAGDDTVMGGLGRDLILGSDGDDTIDGGEGDDLLFGGDLNGINTENVVWYTTDGLSYDGADYITGGPGEDVLYGSYDSRIDTLVGGEGADEIYGWFYKRVRVTSANPRQQSDLSGIGSGRGNGILRPVWKNRTVETELTPDFTPGEGDRRIGYRVK